MPNSSKVYKCHIKKFEKRRRRGGRKGHGRPRPGPNDPWIEVALNGLHSSLASRNKHWYTMEELLYITGFGVNIARRDKPPAQWLLGRDIAVFSIRYLCCSDHTDAKDATSLFSILISDKTCLTNRLGQVVFSGLMPIPIDEV